jgi:hypothetical protein
LKKGDQILVLEKNNNGWWKGECNGVIGLFPSNYVKPFSESQNTTNDDDGVIEVEDESVLRKKKPIGRARVLYSYQGSTSAELTIEPNQVVTILGKLENGWWQGELNGRYGHFPGEYVEEIVDEISESPSNLKKESNEKEPVTREVSTAAETQHEYIKKSITHITIIDQTVIE